MWKHLYRMRFVVFCMAVTTMMLMTSCSGSREESIDTGTRADIFPEYYDLTLPPNIAPLNFVINEAGSRFRVEIGTGHGKPIKIGQRSPTIRIPLREWQVLLEENKARNIYLEISVYSEGVWKKYRRIEHQIATDPIDPYLAYRLVHAVYLKWRDMGIYQRELSTFKESPVIENSSTGHGCMNCHSFANNDPSKMLIHFRILHPGTLIWSGGELKKIDTSTPSTLSAGIYPAWHPGGKFIAFSTGKISPHLTSRRNKVVDVADRESDLMIYDLEKNTVLTSPAISTSRRENMPVWSPDGRTLYYLSAPEAIAGNDKSLLHSHYSLMRIAYSTKLNTWGEAELVLDADSTGMSISMPAISPDGKYMVCSMSDYGYFTIFHRQSDLYLIDLETKAFRKLALNSSHAESFSSWSSNGRWLVFSSKRMDEVFSRTFIAYIDEDGNTHEPFVLPQKDPTIYDRLLANFNLPQLVTGKIELSPEEIRNKVLEDAEMVDFRP